MLCTSDQGTFFWRIGFWLESRTLGTRHPMFNSSKMKLGPLLARSRLEKPFREPDNCLRSNFRKARSNGSLLFVTEGSWERASCHVLPPTRPVTEARWVATSAVQFFLSKFGSKMRPVFKHQLWGVQVHMWLHWPGHVFTGVGPRQRLRSLGQRCCAGLGGSCGREGSFFQVPRPDFLGGRRDSMAEFSTWLESTPEKDYTAWLRSQL